MNITKLKVWPELQKLGFEPIRYTFNGKVVSIGASLRKQLTSVTGQQFYTDIITIEPHNYSDRKNYHVTGDVKTPFTGKLYRYEQNRKVEFFEPVTHINQHYKASKILPTVLQILK